MAKIVVTNQWNDFLVRHLDPYAFAKYRILMQWLGDDLSNKNTLVIGSGSGEFVAILAKAGAKVTALDISQECVDLTKKTADFFDVKISTIVSSIEDYNTAEKFDLIVATDVIEHLKDDHFACSKILSMLYNHGTVLITVPALQFLFGYHDEVLGHYRRYSRSTLLKLTETYFKVSRVRYYGVLLIPVALIISRILRLPYPVQQVGSTAAKNGFFSKFVRFVFNFERFICFPVGTSLLLIGEPRKSASFQK